MVWICTSLSGSEADGAHGFYSDAGWQALLLWKLYSILSFKVEPRAAQGAQQHDKLPLLVHGQGFRL